MLFLSFSHSLRHISENMVNLHISSCIHVLVPSAVLLHHKKSVTPQISIYMHLRHQIMNAFLLRSRARQTHLLSLVKDLILLQVGQGVSQYSGIYVSVRNSMQAITFKVGTMASSPTVISTIKGVNPLEAIFSMT